MVEATESDSNTSRYLAVYLLSDGLVLLNGAEARASNSANTSIACGLFNSEVGTPGGVPNFSAFLFRAVGVRSYTNVIIVLIFRREGPAFRCLPATVRAVKPRPVRR